MPTEQTTVSPGRARPWLGLQVLVAVAVVTVAQLGVGFAQARSEVKEEEGRAFTQAAARAEMAGYPVQRMVQSTFGVAAVLARLPDFWAAGSPSDQTLDALGAALEDQVQFALLSPDLSTQGSSGYQPGRARSDLSDRPYVREASETRTAAFSHAVVTSRLNGQPLLAVAIPVQPVGETTASLLLGGLEVEAIPAIWSQDAADSSERLVLLDVVEGRVLVSSDPATFPTNAPVDGETLQRLRDGQMAFHLNVPRQGDYLRGCALLDGTPWATCADVATESVYGPIYASATQRGVLNVGVALGAGLLLLLLWSHLRQRISAFQRAAVQWRAGHWDYRLGFGGNDELSQLAHTLDDMAEQLGSTVTRIEEAAARTKASEERFRILADGLPSLILLLDPRTGRPVYVNRTEFLGFSREDLQKLTPLFDAIHPDDRLRLLHRWDEAQQGAAGLFEFRVRVPDGSEVWVESRETILQGADGDAPQVLATLTPITERKQQEQERTDLLLREQVARAEAEAAKRLADMRALHEATAMNLADGLAIIGRDERVIFVNPRLEDLYDAPAEKMVGRSIWDVDADLGNRVANARSLQATATEAVRAAFDGRPSAYDLRLGGEVPRELLVLVFPIFGPSGLLGHGRLVRDVTRERELDRLKDELVSVVSHELRTPLTSILGFTELMMSREFDREHMQEFLSIMYREGLRLTALVNDFLDLQRMESGRQEFVIRRTDLASLLRLAAQVVGGDPQHPVVLDVPESFPTVMADPDRVQQVLANLLSNARKYSPDGGEIRLGLRQVGGEAEVSVADQGLGIPAEAMPRLFERFYRVDNSDRREISGTGLGLAISRRIVERLGGQIRAESAGQGKGARFAFTLPLASADDNDPDPTKAPFRLYASGRRGSASSQIDAN